VKILHQGTKPKAYPWVGRYLCADCDSVFSLTEEDAGMVTKWGDDQRDGMSVTIHCPVCEELRSLMQLEYTTTYHDNRAKWDGR
jgi:hypothetical protein